MQIHAIYYPQSRDINKTGFSNAHSVTKNDFKIASKKEKKIWNGRFEASVCPRMKESVKSISFGKFGQNLKIKKTDVKAFVHLIHQFLQYSILKLQWNELMENRLRHASGPVHYLPSTSPLHLKSTFVSISVWE